MKSRRRGILTGLTTASSTVGASAGMWFGLPSTRRWRLLRQILADVTRRVPPARHRPTPVQWNNNQVTIAWLGHATTLINFYGMYLLTDPVFFNHIGINLGYRNFGPKRYVRSALSPTELPEIDVILISHAHMDHFDFASLRYLKSAPQVVTAAETADLFASLPLPTPRELKWGDSIMVKGRCGDLRVKAFEVKHWGRRWPRGRERGYNGYLLERGGRRIVFAGDTAYTGQFANLKSRRPFAVAMMPIAAYNPWIQSHCTPEEAVRMALAAGAERIAPIHHSTFKLSDEPMTEPLARFEATLAAEPRRQAWREIGESISVS